MMAVLFGHACRRLKPLCADVERNPTQVGSKLGVPYSDSAYFFEEWPIFSKKYPPAHHITPQGNAALAK
ncbi:hypothetical protein [Sulfitobacter sp. 20_GPM-1509m]|uniref:hypothetical protein n=1 Tax=Sulfitobacter sp. 20_GPM-1509m TaxID=1380367 RepID=UPI0012DDFD79|nr:hypothetical protein [Sulfitobacter sp. 20_GPM-1509m]